jgi:hypothetical protein
MNKPTLHCPVCGQPTDVAWQTYKPYIDAEYWIATCRNKSCDTFQRTASERHLGDVGEVAKFGARVQYDVYTGAKTRI